MKINPNVSANTAGIQNSETKKTDKAKVSGYQNSSDLGASSVKNESTKTDISSRAKEMAKSKQMAMDTPDVREAKIAELREKIQNKTYNVSADAIADKLVDDHLRMTGA